MAATSSCNLMTLFFFLFLTSTSHAQLSSTFYSTTCPVALSTIKSAVVQAVAADRRMAASLIRLHFHDCFVQGCDASVLLDEQASATSERDALQNRGSLRGFNVIESTKASLEMLCPGVVSCADILAVAARDASVEVSGPSWTVKLGRRDSTTASRSQAESDLPLFNSTLQEHISNFASKGLNQRDLVALSGSHTIGQAQCLTFRDRIYNTASDIDRDFASTRQSTCPATAGSGDRNLAPLDLVTPNVFDNTYFRNLIEKKGLLQSDQILLSGGSTDSIVQEYDTNGATFRADFANAMVKMGDIDPLTGQNGVIRTVCSSLN